MAAPDPALPLPQLNEGKGLRIVHQNNVVAIKGRFCSIRMCGVAMQSHALRCNLDRIPLQAVVDVLGERKELR
jgi:hypothetical protein